MVESQIERTVRGQFLHKENMAKSFDIMKMPKKCLEKGTTLGIKVPESKMFWPAIKLPRALFPAPVIPNIIT